MEHRQRSDMATGSALTRRGRPARTPKPPSGYPSLTCRGRTCGSPVTFTVG
jgi:hypothetical protein